jgi:hypothetical protein
MLCQKFYKLVFTALVSVPIPVAMLNGPGGDRHSRCSGPIKLVKQHSLNLLKIRNSLPNDGNGLFNV